MGKIYFSPTTVGFYISEQERPADAVEVPPELEEFLRRCVIWGATGFEVTPTTAKVTYPLELDEYVSQYNAPTHFPEV